jgi:hypothetical protein
MLTRDQRIAMLKMQRHTQAQAEARADAEIARAADLAAKRAATKVARDSAISLKWKPGTPYPGVPKLNTFNDQTQKWERT